MILFLTSILYAEELNQNWYLKTARGITCDFTEPFFTIRYDFQTNNTMHISYELGVQQSINTLTRQKTDNPFLPQYQLKNGNKEPELYFYVDGNGSNGMSEEVYPINASTSQNSMGHWGGCSFVQEMGTHVVYGTMHHKEPWLNLRTESSTKGEILAKLYDGTEVNILKSKGSWHYVEAVLPKSGKGWVSGTYLKEKIVSPAPQEKVKEAKDILTTGNAPFGIDCTIPESSSSLRYYFDTNTVLSFGKGSPVDISTGHVQTIETENPLILEYLLTVKKQKHPYRLRRDHRGNGMNGTTTLSMYHKKEDGTIEKGGCSFRIVKGTHVVYNTYNEKEPWLNLREKSNLKSKVIRQLSDGTELKLVAEGPTWMYVYVLGQEDYIEKGHVYKKYVRELP